MGAAIQASALAGGGPAACRPADAGRPSRRAGGRRGRDALADQQPRRARPMQARPPSASSPSIAPFGRARPPRRRPRAPARCAPARACASPRRPPEAPRDRGGPCLPEFPGPTEGAGRRAERPGLPGPDREGRSMSYGAGTIARRSVGPGGGGGQDPRQVAARSRARQVDRSLATPRRRRRLLVGRPSGATR